MVSVYAWEVDGCKLESAMEVLIFLSHSLFFLEQDNLMFFLIRYWPCFTNSSKIMNYSCIHILCVTVSHYCHRYWHTSVLYIFITVGDVSSIGSSSNAIEMDSAGENFTPNNVNSFNSDAPTTSQISSNKCKYLIFFVWKIIWFCSRSSICVEKINLVEVDWQRWPEWDSEIERCNDS